MHQNVEKLQVRLVVVLLFDARWILVRDRQMQLVAEMFHRLAFNVEVGSDAAKLRRTDE